MNESIIVALITGGLSLLGVIISNFMASNRTNEVLRVSQAVTDIKIEELTREVREHNNFARRMPVVEEQISALTDRVQNLESKGA